MAEHIFSVDVSIVQELLHAAHRALQMAQARIDPSKEETLFSAVSTALEQSAFGLHLLDISSFRKKVADSGLMEMVKDGKTKASEGREVDT